MSGPDPASALSIVRGVPLEEEPGLGPLTLPGFLREVCTRFAEREALVLRRDGQALRWSYAELWERAVEVARALRACGVGKDTRVGVLMTNRPEWIAAVFGTSLAGGVAVPLSTFSTPPELDQLLQASGVSLLLLEPELAGRDFARSLLELEPEIGAAGPDAELRTARFPHLRRLAMLDAAEPLGRIEPWSAFLARGADEPRALVEATGAAVQPSDRAAIFFSSGTTSKPKGIVNAHLGIAVQLWRFRRMYGLTPDDAVRCWSANGFFWSGNFGMALGGTLASGGSLVLQRTFDPVEALELMEAERVSFPLAWPHQWAALESAPNWPEVDLGAMRFADSAITPFRKHPSVKAPDWYEPGHAYGNTETFTISTGYPVGTPDEVTAGSHGEALPGNTLKIVDPLSGEPMPRGERGEIAVKGPTLMLGYLGVPLAESLDAEGFFRTGDGGYLDAEGRLFWEGRLTEIIKTGGANVSPVEVDAVLAGCPGVQVGRTVGVPHDTLGEMVVACVVPGDGGLDEAAVRAFLKQRLASYKVPRRVLAFAADEISLTGSAKVKAGELRQLAAERLAAAGEPGVHAPA